MSDPLSLYHAKARAELQSLAERMRACSKDGSPVTGSGNPLADVFLVKASPTQEEEMTGVAFSGRSGEVIRKSADRLAVPWEILYGTNLMKCARAQNASCLDTCGRNLMEELLIVQPRLLLMMGESVFATIRNVYDLQGQYEEGSVEQVPGGPKVVATVDFNEAMNGEEAKQALWRDLQLLGKIYSSSSIASMGHSS